MSELRKIIRELWQDDEGEERMRRLVAFDRGITLEQNDCLQAGMKPLTLPITGEIKGLLTSIYEDACNDYRMETIRKKSLFKSYITKGKETKAECTFRDKYKYG